MMEEIAAATTSSSDDDDLPQERMAPLGATATSSENESGYLYISNSNKYKI